MTPLGRLSAAYRRLEADRGWRGRAFEHALAALLIGVGFVFGWQLKPPTPDPHRDVCLAALERAGDVIELVERQRRTGPPTVLATTRRWAAEREVAFGVYAVSRDQCRGVGRS